MHTLMQRAEVEGDLRDRLEELGYVTVGRDGASTSDRFEWEVAHAVGRGLLLEGAAVGDLVDACLEWLDSAVSAASVPGELGQFRVRLAKPGGIMLKQRIVTAVPLEEDQPELDALPDDDALSTAWERVYDAKRQLFSDQRELMTLQRELFGELIDQWRRYDAELLEGWRRYGQFMTADMKDNRENVRALFDAHVRRETAVIERERTAVEELRDAAEAAGVEGESSSMLEGLSDLAMKLVAAHNGVPPELAAMLEDEEMRELLASPALLAQLRDPAVKQMLKNIAQGGL
jgi:hypothetical protein